MKPPISLVKDESGEGIPGLAHPTAQKIVMNPGPQKKVNDTNTFGPISLGQVQTNNLEQLKGDEEMKVGDQTSAAAAAGAERKTSDVKSAKSNKKRVQINVKANEGNPFAAAQAAKKKWQTDGKLASREHTDQLIQPMGLDKSEANTEMLSANSLLEESKKREYEAFENSSNEDVEEVYERIKGEIDQELNDDRCMAQMGYGQVGVVPLRSKDDMVEQPSVIHIMTSKEKKEYDLELKNANKEKDGEDDEEEFNEIEALKKNIKKCNLKKQI